MAAAAFLSACATGRAEDAPPVYSRFGYCAAPVPPPCADATGKNAPSAECRAEADAYVASVFKYRECLSAEMERAVREANAVIERLRCALDRATCARRENNAGQASGKADIR